MASSPRTGSSRSTTPSRRSPMSSSSSTRVTTTPRTANFPSHHARRCSHWHSRRWPATRSAPTPPPRRSQRSKPDSTSTPPLHSSGRDGLVLPEASRALGHPPPPARTIARQHRRPPALRRHLDRHAARRDGRATRPRPRDSASRPTNNASRSTPATATATSRAATPTTSGSTHTTSNTGTNTTDRPTSNNFATLCRRHHRVAHRLGWTLELTDDGWTIWTTPRGYRFWGQRHHRQRAGPCPP